MMDEKRFKINKESIDRLFPKTDPILDYLSSTGYKSPVTTFVERINADLRSEELKAVMNATVRLGVEVDEGELLKALRYDRNQYEEGYHNGYNAGYRKATEVAEEIFAEINSLRDEYSMGDIEYPDFLFRLGKIEKKYTESEKDDG